MTDPDSDARQRAFWEWHDSETARLNVSSTPAQRLAWLEEAIARAYDVG